jgi:hypothetical protein
MRVTIKIDATIGTGDEARRFRLVSHGHAAPIEVGDPSWVVPNGGDEGPLPSEIVRTLARELAIQLALMVKRAEPLEEGLEGHDSSGPLWEDDGNPRPLPPEDGT